VVRQSRLQWIGNAERKDFDDWVSAGRRFKVEGVRERGTVRKTWDKCVREDFVELGLYRVWALDEYGRDDD